MMRPVTARMVGSQPLFRVWSFSLFATFKYKTASKTKSTSTFATRSRCCGSAPGEPGPDRTAASTSASGSSTPSTGLRSIRPLGSKQTLVPLHLKLPIRSIATTRWRLSESAVCLLFSVWPQEVPATLLFVLPCLPPVCAAPSGQRCWAPPPSGSRSSRSLGGSPSPCPGGDAHNSQTTQQQHVVLQAAAQSFKLMSHEFIGDQ